MYEIRLHARGGQGAKTAAQILAEAALKDGLHFQAFPEYGPERSGAPVKSFVRISEGPIHIHSNILTPNAVILIDPTLATESSMCEGLCEGGILLINTTKPLEEIKGALGYSGKILIVDASKISSEIVGSPIAANLVMLGTFSKATDRISLESLKKVVKESFEKKWGKEMVKKNVKALEIGYKSV